MAASLGLVLHVQEGNGSLQGWFNNPASGASSTWWVAKSGTVEQYVDSATTAWAQGDGNATYNSVETEGYTTEPLTQAQVSALADLYRWGHENLGWPYALSDTVGTPGFAWHGMGGAAWGGHVLCPGDLRLAARQTILDLAEGDDMALSDADKQWITQTIHTQVLDIVRSDEFKGRVRDGSQLVIPTDQFKNTVRDQANQNSATWIRSEEFKGRVRDGCTLALEADKTK